jgi:hypothetical protein
LVSSLSIGSALVLGAGCSGGDGSTVSAGAADGGGASSRGGSNGRGGSGGSLNLPQGGQADAGSNGGEGSGDCRADFAAAELKPVHLSFALDVSGSMGKLDEPYHDPVLKWRPVVSAVRSFFEDDASAGISASLTFFPAEDDKCDAASYVEPDVAMTGLPSAAFGDAITAIDPDEGADWRGGTPTLAVVSGSFEYLDSLVETVPDAAHALVLVTDGYPQGCDDEDDDIASVVSAIEAARSRFPTYVIGVKNPTGGPDTVSDLDSLAVAGGTDAAIFIDTGDPAKTSSALAEAIARIRERSVTCEALIPPTPGGRPFDPNRVNVNMELDGQPSQLGYDQDCEAAGWRYDDADAPKSIVLCPTTCEVVQSNATANLDVAFGCVTRPVVK